MFESLLIANRGEIARRVIRTARHMGIRTLLGSPDFVSGRYDTGFVESGHVHGH